MNEHPTNEERETMILGDRAAALDDDEQADLAMVAALLADPSTWAEPNTGLEDAVVQAVATAPAPAQPRSRRRLLLSAVAAAAVLVALAVAGIGILVRTSSPDYRAALDGTELAPGAHASANIDRNNAGFHITLDAHGLPTLPAGEYYQAWLKNNANVLVPIGTFSSSDGRITLWSGVSPIDFPTMTVTIEKADNQQESSGRRVLTGVAHKG
jgi:hypothetical protein